MDDALLLFLNRPLDGIYSLLPDKLRTSLLGNADLDVRLYHARCFIMIAEYVHSAPANH